MPFRGGGVHPIEFGGKAVVSQAPVIALALITVLPCSARKRHSPEFSE